MINDFWTELIEPKNKQWKEEQEIINGISYRVFTLKKKLYHHKSQEKLLFHHLKYLRLQTGISLTEEFLKLLEVINPL